MIWTVPRAWPGETVFILAGGPSLKSFDRNLLKGRRVITINDSWRLMPWADVHYFCDARWWQQQHARERYAHSGEAFRHVAASDRWVTIAKVCESHQMVRVLKNTGQLGLEEDPAGLRTGNNSGFQAINLAYHYGVKRIVLLGYDMHVQGKVSHWHDEERSANFQSHCERHFLPCFQSLVRPLAEAGVEVINATPGSALTLWPHLPLEEAVKDPAKPVLKPVAGSEGVGVGCNYPLFPETV